MSELHTIESLDRQPFKYMVATIGNLPTSFVDSMSYYELLAWLCQYLEKTVIPAIDNNAEALEELQAKFIELKTYVDNYFDNLDVQEEINNKLDDMAESGQLADIIAQYIQLAGVLAYDTVAAMKVAENLANGSTAQTLGYHAANDGGAALYKIRTITNEDVIDEGSIIALADETLVAELIADEANVKQFGAYGDNEHDDTTALSNAMLYARKEKVAVFLPKGDYIVTDHLPSMDAGSVIYGDNQFTSAKDGLYYTKIIDNRSSNREWLIQYYQADPTNLVNKSGTCIKNIAFINEDDDKLETKWLINFQYIMARVNIENVSIEGYERCFFANDTHNFNFKNVYCNKVGSYTNNETHYWAFEFQGLFCSIFDHVQTDGCRYAFKLTTREGSTLDGQVKFIDCHFEQGSTFHNVSTSSTDAMFVFSTGYCQQFVNCMFVPNGSDSYESNAPFTIYGTSSTTLQLSNCYFYAVGTGQVQGKFIYAQTLIDNCFFNNCASQEAISLVGKSNVSNSRFIVTRSQNIDTYQHVISNAIEECGDCKGNILSINLSGITSLSVVPTLFTFYKPYKMSCTSNKYIKQQWSTTADKWNNALIIQKTHSDYSLAGIYHIRMCDIVNPETFYYEGLVRVNNDMTMEKVSTIAQNGLSTYPIDIYIKNGIMQIQCSRYASRVKLEVLNVEDRAITYYYRKGLPVSTVDATHLYINS